MRKQKIALLLISQKVASGCQQTINGFDSAQYFDFGNILNKIKLEQILRSMAVSFATEKNIWGNCKSLSLVKISFVLPKLAPAHCHLFHKSYVTIF